MKFSNALRPFVNHVYIIGMQQDVKLVYYLQILSLRSTQSGAQNSVESKLMRNQKFCFKRNFKLEKCNFA